MEYGTALWTCAGRRLTAVGSSVIGTRYQDNYDVVHVDGAQPLAVVADGMGDGPGSSAAGRAAVDVFVQRAVAPHSPGVLRATVAEVHRTVRAAGRSLPGLTGCTLTAFVADPVEVDSAAWLVQLGDSRAYRYRDGLLELLTVDHTVSWLGVLHGQFTLDSPEGRAARYRLTRYAGHPALPEPDVISVGLRPGDLYLLCTDGVTDQVSYERMTQLLEPTTNPITSVEHLLDETLLTGNDNATAVLIRVG